MMMNSEREVVFFAGGYYHPTEKKKQKDGSFITVARTDLDKEFGLVSRSGDDGSFPYLTMSEKGLKSTAHHANLYAVVPGERDAWLADYRCGEASNPYGFVESVEAVNHVILSQDQAERILEAYNAKYFYP